MTRLGEGRVIEGDLFGIADRLRSIDPDYFVWRSYRHHRYEVHVHGQRGDTLALVVPYERLDERTVRLVLKTRRERADELLKEAERHNALLLRQEAERAARRAAVETERALSAM